MEVKGVNSGCHKISSIESPLCSNGCSSLGKTMRMPLSRLYAEVRLKKEVSTSEAEENRRAIYQAILTLERAQNWKRVKFDEELTKFTYLIDEVVVGSTSESDGSEVLVNGLVLHESNLHFYHLKRFGSESHDLSLDEESCASKIWELPCYEFDQLWENLIFDDNIKNDLLAYVASMLHMSDLKVNASILRINRLILLFGPPGTGKTSLCKSLAQKLSIMLNARYKRSICVEINSHSLFSKWFSESGKLVLKMFDQIEELAEDGRTFIVVLIDEVESLSMTRKASLNRNEPMDSVRVVNALLTQIDRIRRCPNVLMLTTSNLNEILDEAFVDRADICRWIGPPSISSVYQILFSCVEEMQRIGIVEAIDSEDSVSFHEELLNVSKTAAGVSARVLRQVPVIAYSRAAEDCISTKECLRLFLNVLNDRKVN